CPQGLRGVAGLRLVLARGLLVFPSELGAAAGKGVLLAVIITLVARPMAVRVAAMFSDLSRSELALLSWGGLRGAIPVVLATFAVIAHVPRSLHFFNVVFFAVVVSAVVQGSTVELLARRLRVF